MQSLFFCGDDKTLLGCCPSLPVFLLLFYLDHVLCCVPKCCALHQEACGWQAVHDCGSESSITLLTALAQTVGNIWSFSDIYQDRTVFPLKTVLPEQYITQQQRNFIKHIENNNVIFKDRNCFGKCHQKIIFLEHIHVYISSLR